MTKKLMKRAENLPVGATIKVGPGKFAKVIAQSTVGEVDFELLGRRYQGRNVTIHTNKGDILTTLPCHVEIVD